MITGAAWAAARLLSTAAALNATEIAGPGRPAELVVEGSAGCPDPAEVKKELAQMLAPRAAVTETARVSERAQSFVVELFAAHGERLVFRQVAASGSCAERARVAAVILAARWSETHPEWVTEVPARPVVPPVPAPRHPAVAGLSGRVPVPAVPRAPGSNHRHFDLGAGLAASQADTTFNLGGLASIAWLPERRGWGAHLGVAFDGVRTVAIPNAAGTVAWRRVPVALGPAYRIGFRTWNLDLRAAGVLARTAVEGRDFLRNERSTDWSVGVSTGARAATRGAGLTSWVDVSMTGWRSQVVYSEGNGAGEAALPGLSFMVAVGASFCAGCAGDL